MLKDAEGRTNRAGLGRDAARGPHARKAGVLSSGRSAESFPSQCFAAVMGV